MSKGQYPSVEYLRQCFREENGKLYWLERPVEHFKTHMAYYCWNGKHSGNEAGVPRKIDNRQVIRLQGHLYLRSRIIWALYYGELPANMIDHINHDPTDDRIENLRDATPSQNSTNSRTRKNTISGHKGVYLDKRDNRWYVRLNFEGKQYSLRGYDAKEKAVEVRTLATAKICGEYGCH